MAVLQPNATYKMNGVTVREKIIPDGTRWKDGAKARPHGFEAGNLYKKKVKLSSNSGKVKYITIHNTDDIKGTNDDAEQYTRATYNENMGSARVHFYVDDVGAWQNLKAGTGLCKADPAGSAEVGWHAGDGSEATGGNMTSIGIEIIMNDTAAHDVKAKDNGARVAAWLLFKHGLTVDKLVSHTYWVNHALGYKFADPDIQSTNMVYGKKWCPQYIFASTSETVALANWRKFKALVSGYLDALHGKKANTGTNTTETPKNATGGTSSGNTGSKTPTEVFRVRKSPNDAKSQLGAFMYLDGAKKKVNENPGYRAYNSALKAVYPTVDMIAREVIAGKWGTGTARKTALTEAGYNYADVQAKVNAIMKR